MVLCHGPEKRAMPHLFCKDVPHNADLEMFTAQIKHDLDETASWIPPDMEETATRIQTELEKMELLIQSDLKIPVCEVQLDLDQTSSKIQRDLQSLVAQNCLVWKADEILPKVDRKDQSDFNELASWTQHDLDRTAARIQCELDEAAAWIQRDMDELAGRIQRDLEKLESQIQHDLNVPEDRVQCDLEETSIRIQKDLQDLVAQWQLSMEVRTDQIKTNMDEDNKQVQHKLETGDWIQTEIERTVSHILSDLNVPVDQFVRDLDEILIQTQRDLEFIQEEVAEQKQYNLAEGTAMDQPKWEEKDVLIPNELGIELNTPHCELVENARLHRGMSLENFELHKVLGRGSFGKVMLAEFKETGQYFAIKTLKKDNILAEGNMHFLMSEKRVLKLAAECPFLAHLYFTFQTKDSLFFVMEYINGGDLFFHIEEKGRFDLVSTQFYSAEMICGLQFLHRNGVIYRDLKLENVMLDRHGHIKIVDFGLSKDNMFGDDRTESFCGSEHYVAPEIFQGQQYFSPVDWWSFGVLLFEMLTGMSPFHGTDEKELHMSVCMDIPQYPHWITQESKDILEKLLEKDPNRRLGTFGNIREHPFFDSIDWSRLERREVEPPFKPKLVSPNDCTYFDEQFLNETPQMSHGDSRYIGSMEQSAFADFSFINSVFCSTY